MDKFAFHRCFQCSANNHIANVCAYDQAVCLFLFTNTSDLMLAELERSFGSGMVLHFA